MPRSTPRHGSKLQRAENKRRARGPRTSRQEPDWPIARPAASLRYGCGSTPIRSHRLIKAARRAAGSGVANVKRNGRSSQSKRDFACPKRNNNSPAKCTASVPLRPLRGRDDRQRRRLVRRPRRFDHKEEPSRIGPFAGVERRMPIVKGELGRGPPLTRCDGATQFYICAHRRGRKAVSDLQHGVAGGELRFHQRSQRGWKLS